MECDQPLSLPYRAIHAIPDAAKVRIRCTQGSLWLTLDNDVRDIVLGAGDSFATSEHRRVMLYALEPASFVLLPPMPDRAHGRARGAYALAG
jgi:hypothetical protein